MSNDSTKYNKILNTLRQKTPGISGAVLANTEGLLITAVVPTSYDTEPMGTIASSSINIIQDSIEQLRKKGLTQVLINGKDGIIILRMIMNELILVVMAERNIKLALLNYQVQQAAHQIGELLERG